MKDQLFTATPACEARIENGASISEAFQWLNEEMEAIMNGGIIYED